MRRFRVISSVLAIPNADNGTFRNYAPDFSQDKIRPYSGLKNLDGSNLTIVNIRGARLFCYKGCSIDEANAIAEAHNDFNSLANQLIVYNKMDWDDRVSTFRRATGHTTPKF